VLCSGLDSVPRGYETHTRSLFEALRAELRPRQCVLFKGDGDPREDEVVLRRPFRTSKFVQRLKRWRGSSAYWETLFFGLRFVAHSALAQDRYRVILTIEPMAAKTLWLLRVLLGGARLVYTHGVRRHPDAYVRTAHRIHEVNVEHYARATRRIGTSRMRLVPHFTRALDGAPADHDELRRRHGVRTQRVLLAVGAIDAADKRADHLVQETARLGEAWTLVLCGEAHEPEIVRRGREMLGDRLVVTQVPRGRMVEVYALADVFASASLREGFGIATIEAMSAGLPVLLHDRPLSRWILGSGDGCVDMTRPGALADAVTAWERDPGARRAVGARNRAMFAARYTWSAVRAAYLELLDFPRR
jgi:glycosyltransferase involved in cell wall biosynthesis